MRKTAQNYLVDSDKLGNHSHSLKNYKIVGEHKYGEVFVFAAAMGIIMHAYQNQESNLRPSYMALFRKFWGKN